MKAKAEDGNIFFDDSQPLKINLVMFLASERKQAVIQMANVKLHNTTDELPLKVFKVLTDLDKDSYI